MSLIDDPPRKLRALIYNRVSSDPTGRSISVDSQDAENRAFCAQRGWDVVATITDNDRSASRFATRQRSGYTEVKRAIGAGELDVLVCWEASRTDRDLAAYAQFRDLCVASGVMWAYSGRVYDLSRTDDRFTTGMDSLLAEREAAVIRDRVKRGIDSAAAKGNPHGTVPYGYRRERDPRTGAIAAQVPDPDTAPVVQGIVARLLAGDALYSIAADLNRRGEPTPQGRKELAAGIDRGRLWSSATIRVLLASQSMTGVRTHKGVPHLEATWEPIVSAQDWLRVQGVLSDPHRARHHRGVEPRHLLAGIAECGVCGAWLRAASNRGRDVYQCAGWGVGDPRGKGHVSRGPRIELDAMVSASAIGRLSDPQLPHDLAAQDGQARDTTDRLAAELAGLRRQMADIEQAAATVRGAAAASLVRIVADLGEQIDTRDAQLAASVPSGMGEVLAVSGTDAATRWGGLALPEQRRLIRVLLRVVVSRSTFPSGRRGFDRDSVAVTARL